MKSVVERVGNWTKAWASGLPALARYLQKRETITYTPKGWDGQVTAHADSVVPWHDWPHADLVGVGWEQTQAGYTSRRHAFPQVHALIIRTDRGVETFDLRDVATLSASKGNLQDHADLDAFATKEAGHFLTDLSLEGLDKNLDHSQVRIGRAGRNPTGSDHWAVYQWDRRRPHLVNGGGSHHLAAARYIARKLGTPVGVSAPSIHYQVDATQASALLRSFHLFAVGKDTYQDLHEPFQAGAVPYTSTGLPGDKVEGGRVIFLARTDQKASQAAQLLKDHGALDVGELLKKAYLA